VEEIIVGDDCSIPANEQSVAGKRGLVGMLFVIKIAGAFAERGLSLPEVAEIARSVSQNTATYGVGLSACALPGNATIGDNRKLPLHSRQDTHTCAYPYLGQYYAASYFRMFIPASLLKHHRCVHRYLNISKRYK